MPWVYDWRAPVSSLFYDHETGPAHYEAPSGTIPGDLTLKRQFRIRDSEMDFMLDVSVNIVDDVLQDTLAQASDDGMRNIVATIQRDQNAIIRDAEAHTLILQGVAGSGKTSIALHRIAFLLYRFKDTLRSGDILIISPNRVCGDRAVRSAIHHRVRKEERAVIRTALRGMVKRTTLRKAYAAFFDWIERPELFKPKAGKLEYADVFPLIYLQMLTEGV